MSCDHFHASYLWRDAATCEFSLQIVSKCLDTVIVLWVEVEVILLLVPAFWSLWHANTVAIIAKTGAQEDTKLAINTTRATNTELVGIDAWMTSLFKTMACNRTLP